MFYFSESYTAINSNVADTDINKKYDALLQKANLSETNEEITAYDFLEDNNNVDPSQDDTDAHESDRPYVSLVVEKLEDIRENYQVPMIEQANSIYKIEKCMLSI